MPHSAGVIAASGSGSAAGLNSFTMTVDSTNSKGVFFYGFATDTDNAQGRTVSDEAKHTFGILSPTGVSVSSETYPVIRMLWSNADGLNFWLEDVDSDLSSASVASLTTSVGTIALSGGTFNQSGNMSKWTVGTTTNLFGTVDGASVNVTVNLT